MELKKRTFRKTGLLLLVIGGLGLTIITIIVNSSMTPGRYYIPRPIIHHATFVNSRGEAHFISNSSNSVHVYNNEGVFLYRFYIPMVGGIFYFYFDENDIFHTFVSRGTGLLSFDEGILMPRIIFDRFDEELNVIRAETRLRHEERQEASSQMPTEINT